MTYRTTSGAQVRPPLTDLENEVMHAVWDGGTCTVEAVYQIVSTKRKLKETTIRTLLRRLEKKGYLQHESDGRAYIYRAVEPARSLAARAVRQIIDRFCQGSVEELVSGVVEAKVLNKGDIDQLEKFVRNRRPGGGPMERLFLECAVRAALLAGAIAIVLYAMRVKAVAAKHSIWAGVVVMMLLLPLWTALGPKVPLRVLPPFSSQHCK